MKRIFKVGLISLTTMMLAAGCTGDVDPKTYVNEVTAKVDEKKSYSFEGSSKVQIRYTGAVEKGIAANFLSELFDDLTVQYKGVYSEDPEQMELTVKLNMGGKRPIETEIPMVITDDDVYFQLAESNLITLPKSLQDRYIKVDVAEDKEASEKEAQLTSLINDVTMIIIDHLDEDKYYKDIAANEVPAAEGVEIDQAIEIAVDNETVSTFLQDSFEEIGLEILDLIESKYMDTLGISDPQMRVAREAISETQKELDKSLATIDDYIEIEQFDLIYAADSDQFITYQGSDADMTFKGKDGDLRIVMSANTSFTKINETPEFEVGIPKDVLSLEDLEELFNDIEVPGLPEGDAKDASL